MKRLAPLDVCYAPTASSTISISVVDQAVQLVDYLVDQFLRPLDEERGERVGLPAENLLPARTCVYVSHVP
jgi:hypothetical protein